MQMKTHSFSYKRRNYTMKREISSEESESDEKKLCLDSRISPNDNDSRQEATKPGGGTLRPAIYTCDRKMDYSRDSINDYFDDDDRDVLLYEPLGDDETPAPVDEYSPSPCIKSRGIGASLTPVENALTEIGIATKGPEAEEIEENEMYDHPPSAAPLRRQMLEDNQHALTNGKPDDVVRKMSAHSIKREDLLCFKPTQLLTDTLIDCYFELMKQNYKQDDRKYRKTYVFYSTFYNLLAMSMELVEDTADDVNIFEFELLMFPVCITSHWRLIVANISDRTVRAYNSMYSFSPGDKVIVRNIITYLTSEYQRVISRQNKGENKQNVGADTDTLMADSFTCILEDVPQQDNTFDCGIFVLLFANYLWRNMDFDFCQRHIPYFRQKIFYELCTGQLLS